MHNDQSQPHTRWKAARLRAAVLCALLLAVEAAAADSTQELVGLEQRLTDALSRSDADTVSALWADDLVWIGLNGKPSSKAEQLATVKPPVTGEASAVIAVTNKEVKVRLYDRSAVVTVLSAWRTRAEAGERTTDFVATHVWSRRGGQWQLVSAHISRVAQP